MQLRTIRTFLAISECGQLNRAADLLNVTQSTITARLNSLEEELGQSLFHRRKSGAELTSAGFRFERYAQLLIDTWRQARQETALPETVESTFNLGCHPDLWPNLGDQLLAWMNDNQKNLAISVWSGDQHELDRWLTNGLIDTAICYSPTVVDNRTIHSLPPDDIVLVATELGNSPGTDKQYVYVDGGETFRKEYAIAYTDIESPTLTFGSAIWACAHLLNSSGSGYLPRRLIQKELQSGGLFENFVAKSFKRNIYIVLSGKNEFVETWVDQL